MLSQSTVFGQKVLWGILSSFLLTVYGTIQGQATRTSLCQIRMAITTKLPEILSHTLDIISKHILYLQIVLRCFQLEDN